MSNNRSSQVLKELPEEEKHLIFAKGTLINIKHPRVFEGMLNTIVDYKDDFLYVKLTEPFIKGSVLIGDKVRCQILSRDYEYIAYGEVYHIDISSPGIVKILNTKTYRYHNIRRDKRYLVNFPTNVFERPGSSAVYSIIKNISLSGMAIVCNHKFQTLIDVDLKFSTNVVGSKYIELKANIIRESPSEGYNEYGLMIRDMDETNKQEFLSLIDRLENRKVRLIGMGDFEEI
ncbi:MAG: PilZ domain-containing protein [Clostridiaceae bacterium]|jgi:hypothetical protein|nr:PilZ domain-containing protein [Clostridiaceae bacterium]